MWRRSYKKQFFLFDVAQQKVIPSKFDDFNLDSEDDSEFCLYANWAPTLSANKDRISRFEKSGLILKDLCRLGNHFERLRSSVVSISITWMRHLHQLLSK